MECARQTAGRVWKAVLMQGAWTNWVWPPRLRILHGSCVDFVGVPRNVLCTVVMAAGSTEHVLGTEVTAAGSVVHVSGMEVTAAGSAVRVSGTEVTVAVSVGNPHGPGGIWIEHHTV